MVLAVFHCCQGICSLPVEGLCNREGSASDGEELEVAEEEEGPGDRQAEELWARHTSASLVLSDLEHDTLVPPPTNIYKFSMSLPESSR